MDAQGYEGRLIFTALGFRVVLGSDCQIRATFGGKAMLCSQDTGIGVNLFAMIELCRVFVPGMVERGYGRVINLTSGIKDTPHLAPYSVSKAAVKKYTQDLAAHLSGTNVLANCLDPGWLKTDLGGPNADHEVETVLPGALVPALLDDNGPSGRIYAAQDFKCLG